MLKARKRIIFVLVAILSLAFLLAFFSIDSPAYADGEELIIVENFSKIYDGAATPIPYTLDESIEGETIDIVYGRVDNYSSDAPTEIGVYNAVLSYDDYSVTVSYSIVAPFTAQNFTKSYNGEGTAIPYEKHALMPEEEEATVTYIGEDYDSEEPPVNIGEYTATLSYGAYSIDRLYTITIGMVEQAEFNDLRVLYNGEMHSIFVEGVEGFNVSYVGNGVKNVGLYSVVATISKENYQTRTMTAKIYIMAKELASSENNPSAVITNDAGIEPQLALLVLDKTTDEALNLTLADVLEQKETSVERVSAIYQLKLSEEAEAVGEYRVKLRIPESISGQWNMRLVKINDATVSEVNYIVEEGYCVFTDNGLNTYAFLTTEATESGERAATIIFYAVIGIAGLIGLLVLLQFLKNLGKGRREKRSRFNRYV